MYRDLNEIHQPQDGTQPPYVWFKQAAANQRWWDSECPVLRVETVFDTYLNGDKVMWRRGIIDWANMMSRYDTVNPVYFSIPDQTDIEIPYSGLYLISFGAVGDMSPSNGSHRGVRIELESAGVIADTYAPGIANNTGFDVGVTASTMWYIEAGDMMWCKVLHDTTGAVYYHDLVMSLVYLGGYRNELQPSA